MKERLDVLLVDRGLAPSREKAKAIIMEGNVFVGGQREDKAGTLIDAEAAIEVKGNPLKYVSRGGLKLEKALERFGIPLEGRICMDIGASTGGFTDCMLQNGAAKVYAVDVGYGQLAWKLRQDPRVVCMEKTNIRYVKPEDIADALDFASVDVSFISLTKVLIPARGLLKDKAGVVCLIKPQFEAGRGKVGKHGVVREKAIHREVIAKVADFAQTAGFSVRQFDFSPIKGPEGNIEYLMYLTKGDGGRTEGAAGICVAHWPGEKEESWVNPGAGIRVQEACAAGGAVDAKGGQAAPGAGACEQEARAAGEAGDAKGSQPAPGAGACEQEACAAGRVVDAKGAQAAPGAGIGMQEARAAWGAGDAIEAQAAPGAGIRMQEARAAGGTGNAIDAQASLEVDIRAVVDAAHEELA